MAFGESIMNVCIAICIDRCMTFASGRVGRLLEWKADRLYRCTQLFALHLATIIFEPKFDSISVHIPLESPTRWAVRTWIVLPGGAAVPET